MKKYALDTNIVSLYLRGDNKIVKKIGNLNRESGFLIIPPVVYVETKRGLIYLNAAKKLVSFEKLYQTNGIDIIEKYVMDIAVNIYVQLKRMKPSITIDDDDLLIAAYCLQNECILVTANTKHFENIDGLQIENWVNEALPKLG